MKKLLIASAVTMLASLSGLASAATATATFTVSLTIKTGCTVTATNIAPAPVDASTVADVTGSNTISVTCTKGTPYNIGLQSTQANSKTDGTGTMVAQNVGTTGNTDSIPYALYQDSGLTKAWGNVAANTLAGTVSTNGTSATNYNAYMKVLGADITNRTADKYQDTIQVNVNY